VGSHRPTLHDGWRKNAHARVRKVGQPELTDLRTCGAREHLSVKRAPSAEEGKLAKRLYRYRGYYIEVVVQEVGVKHFEGTAAIFGSLESARSGQGPVHRCARMGRTREEADRAASASAESWAEGPGKRA